MDTALTVVCDVAEVQAGLGMSYSGSSNNLSEDRRLHQSRSQALLVSLGKTSNKLQDPGMGEEERGKSERRTIGIKSREAAGSLSVSK